MWINTGNWRRPFATMIIVVVGAILNIGLCCCPVAVADDPPSSAPADERDAEFDRNARKLALLYRSATPVLQMKLRRQLETLNAEHFEYRQQQRQRDIDRLSGRIDTLRDLQRRRDAHKDEILNRRLTDLLDPNADLSWDVPQADETGKSSSKPQSAEDTNPTGVYASDATTKTNSGVTYEGLSANDCLKLLNTERSPERLFTVITAATHLIDEFDPPTLIRALLRMTEHQTAPSLFHEVNRRTPPIGALAEIVQKLPTDLVIDGIIAELDTITPRNKSDGFLGFLAFVFSSVEDNRSYWLQHLSPHVPVGGSLFDEDDTNENQIRGVFRRRSSNLIGALSRFAQRDAARRDWVVEMVFYLLPLSEQTLTSYPELIPVVERVFRESESKSTTGVAAALLGSSGRNLPEALKFLKEALHRQGALSSKSPADFIGEWDYFVSFDAVVNCLAIVGAQSHEAVKVLSDQLQARSKAIEIAGAAEAVNFDIPVLVMGLGRAGAAAKSSLPLLRSIEESPIANAHVMIGSYQISDDPRYPTFHGNLKRYVADAIKQIETAKPPAAQESINKDESIPDRGSAASTDKPTGVTPVAPEPTYDGVPYSTWMKMLETERKPQKLMAAIEACGQLAPKSDQRRVAQLIFRAASVFEPDQPHEQPGDLWRTPIKTLQLLPAEMVMDQLLEALRNEEINTSQRRFIAGLIVLTAYGTLPQISAPLYEALKSRAAEVIPLLLQQAGNGTDYLLAAASQLWSISKRPLSDFPGLESHLIKFIDAGPQKDQRQPPSSNTVNPWLTVTYNLIQNAPDLPDLALLLARHIRIAPETVPWIGKLGHRAEPAVPLLIEEFLHERKEFDTGCVKANLDSQFHSNWNSVSQALIKRQVQLVQAIGEIGVGPKGYSLLRVLELIAPGRIENGIVEHTDAPLFHAVDKAIKKLGTVVATEPSPTLLSDVTLINGDWMPISMVPLEWPPNISAIIRNGMMQTVAEDEPALVKGLAPLANPFYFIELDDSVKPKTFTLRTIGGDPQIQRRGIYELSEMKLRLQFGKIGGPLPTEFANDKSQLPESQLLVEFERQRRKDQEPK